MVNDVLGANQEDEYGDYGNETAGYKKVEEVGYDFM